jgi:hypothetical protein
MSSLNHPRKAGLCAARDVGSVGSSAPSSIGVVKQPSPLIARRGTRHARISEVDSGEKNLVNEHGRSDGGTV